MSNTFTDNDFDSSNLPQLEPPESPAIEERLAKVSAKQVRKVKDEHKHIAMLIALGWSNKSIADDVKLAASTIQTIRTSPNVRQWIRYFRAQIEDQVLIQNITKRLTVEFPEAIDKIAELRDSGMEESTQLQAAKFLAEKAIDAVVPKKTILEEVKKVGVVIMDVAEMERLKLIAKEDDNSIPPIEVTGEVIQDD